ncbi:DUF4372 domain-containing protein [Alteribacillus sp. JSM 102045]|uniref:DUF4372 domain-containing protein n=1 Tax=Alteribacillus sp. JSM 102045 TaxID=1562101 RepID=UPI0035C09149
MDNHTTKTVFKKYIHPLETKVVQKMIDSSKTDRYVKKLDTLSFMKLFILAQLKGLSSLRRISETVKRNKMVQQEIGLKSISKSQCKNQSIPNN